MKINCFKQLLLNKNIESVAPLKNPTNYFVLTYELYKG